MYILVNFYSDRKLIAKLRNCGFYVNNCHVSSTINNEYLHIYIGTPYELFHKRITDFMLELIACVSNYIPFLLFTNFVMSFKYILLILNVWIYFTIFQYEYVIHMKYLWACTATMCHIYMTWLAQALYELKVSYIYL